MALNVMVWILLFVSASAMDPARDTSARDFDDYEMNNIVESGPYWIEANYPDYSDLDWKRHLVFFKLMKALQDKPERFYKSDRDPTQYEQNMYDAMDVKGADKKRGSEVKGNKKPSQKGIYVRPQPKLKPRKQKVFLCLFKICDFRPRY